MKNDNRCSQLLLFTFALTGLVCSHPASAVNYTITDLGTLRSTDYSKAFGINDGGQVVGISFPIAHPTVSVHAFLYTNGAMTDIGSLGSVDSYAYGINNSGQIVGRSLPSGNMPYHAFLSSYGVMTDLGTLGGASSSAYGINNNGQVVGVSSTNNVVERAFLYSNGVMSDLGALNGTSSGTSSTAYAINNYGEVVGGSSVNSGGTHAFLYSNGVMTDLGTLGGTTLTWREGYSVALGVNDNGTVVGYSLPVGNDPFRAFLYENGAMKDLGALGGKASRAYDINNNGEVVGWADDADNNIRPFLYRNGTMTDLNSLLPANSGWILGEATAINDRGQIVGVGGINGQGHAFLMTPVPVPGGLWLFGSGLLGLLRIAKRRKR